MCGSGKRCGGKWGFTGATLSYIKSEQAYVLFHPLSPLVLRAEWLFKFSCGFIRTPTCVIFFDICWVGTWETGIRGNIRICFPKFHRIYTCIGNGNKWQLPPEETPRSTRLNVDSHFWMLEDWVLSKINVVELEDWNFWLERIFVLIHDTWACFGQDSCTPWWRFGRLLVASL